MKTFHFDYTKMSPADLRTFIRAAKKVGFGIKDLPKNAGGRYDPELFPLLCVSDFGEIEVKLANASYIGMRVEPELDTLLAALPETLIAEIDAPDDEVYFTIPNGSIFDTYEEAEEYLKAQSLATDMVRDRVLPSEFRNQVASWLAENT